MRIVGEFPIIAVSIMQGWRSGSAEEMEIAVSTDGANLGRGRIVARCSR